MPAKRKGTFVTTVPTWGATISQVLELIDFLTAARVTTMVMEATSDYWKPFYYLMEDALPVMLVNAKQARNIPGRKRPTCPMRPGSRSWPRTGCCGRLSCLPDLSASCGT